MRTDLGQAARAWVSAQVGAGSRIVRVRRLPGASSSVVHALDVQDRSGLRHPLVLRRFVDRAWLAREPDLASREAATLVAIAGRGIAAPELVGVDADGTGCGVPAVLGTRLPGRVDLAPRDPTRWLRELRAALEPIHAARVDHPSPRIYRRYHEGHHLRPPSWSRRQVAWTRAIEIVDSGPPPGPVTLIHRDYHPLNTLWRRGRCTGVVDWVESCVGDPGVDLGHCRQNLALLLGLDAADEFSADCDPYWDLASATDALDWPLPLASFRDAGRTDLDAARLEARLDEFVGAAVSRAGRSAP